MLVACFLKRLIYIINNNKTQSVNCCYDVNLHDTWPQIREKLDNKENWNKPQTVNYHDDMGLKQKETRLLFFCFGVLPVKCREMFILKFFFIDVSPGNRRQTSSENRAQGGKPTLSESSKKYNS